MLFYIVHEILTKTFTVSKLNKNKISQEYCDRVTKCYNEGTLRFTNLQFATIVWEDNFDSNSGLFEAQCEYLKPTYRDMVTDRLIDVGIHGNWKISEQIMKDYDININEWDDKGYPTNSDGQLKPIYWFFFKVKRQVFLTLLIFFHFQKSIMASSLMASVIFKTSLRLSVSRLFYRTSPRYFIKWVLSIGRVRLDLWCKDQNIPFENSCSTTIFLYFNLKLKTFFYKQCWPYIQKIFFWKNLS